MKKVEKLEHKLHAAKVKSIKAKVASDACIGACTLCVGSFTTPLRRSSHMRYHTLRCHVQ